MVARLLEEYFLFFFYKELVMEGGLVVGVAGGALERVQTAD